MGWFSSCFFDQVGCSDAFFNFHKCSICLSYPPSQSLVVNLLLIILGVCFFRILTLTFARVFLHYKKIVDNFAVCKKNKEENKFMNIDMKWECCLKWILAYSSSISFRCFSAASSFIINSFSFELLQINTKRNTF